MHVQLATNGAQTQSVLISSLSKTDCGPLINVHVPLFRQIAPPLNVLSIILHV